MRKIIFLPILFAMLLCACASITTGTKQNIGLDTEPEGADCKLSNDEGAWYVSKTPSNIEVHRSYSPLNINCKKGKMTGVLTVQSTTKGSTFGNILLGGGIGAAVDMSNGAAYDYPTDNRIKLK